METLFDNNHTAEVIVPQLPGTPQEQMTTDAIVLLTNPTGRLAAAFQRADGTCKGWSPRAPTRLYMASGDHEVPNVHSYTCWSQLGARHVDAPVDLGRELGHLETNVVGTRVVLRWFRRLR
jgi:hypothetical protein